MAIKLRDLFKPKHKEDKARREKQQDQFLEVRQNLKDIGQACMADSKFTKYKETYQMLERLTFDKARQYKNADPVQYAMVISNMLTELNTLETLIADVQQDASKKMPAPKVSEEVTK